MHLIARAALTCTALLLAPAAMAQEQDPPADEPAEIVVTGRELEEQIRDFVGALTPTRYMDETISRFEESVCPAVRGLTPVQNDLVERRIRAVAEAVGLQVEREGCVTNTLLIVTSDKNAFIRELAARRPWFFGDMTALQIRRLARSPGPAAAWQLKGLVSADGHPIYYEDGTGYYLNRSSQSASRGRPAARWVFEGSALVVERRALAGLDTTQLADYASMRLFARTDPARVANSGTPTILNILEAPMGSPVPLTLTQWDLTFLRGVYASPENQRAASQRSAIAQRMRRELQTPEEEQD